MRISKILVAAIVALSCGTIQIIDPTTLAAAEPKLEVADPDAVKKALESLVGKNVSVRLRSGDEIGGVVEAVGPAAVRIGQLTGKEFFSAIVKLEDVAAVVFRVQ